jgi:ribosomal protein L37AE/L43A
MGEWRKHNRTGPQTGSGGQELAADTRNAEHCVTTLPDTAGRHELHRVKSPASPVNFRSKETNDGNSLLVSTYSASEFGGQKPRRNRLVVTREPRVKSSELRPTLGVCQSCDRLAPVVHRTRLGCFVCTDCRDELDAHGAELNPAWVKLGKRYTE